MSSTDFWQWSCIVILTLHAVYAQVQAYASYLWHLQHDRNAEILDRDIEDIHTSRSH